MTFDPAQLEGALARVEALEDAGAREAARAAVTAVLELHAGGVRRLSELLRRHDAEGALARAAADDPVVAAVLALHGAHPLSVEERATRALDDLRARDVEAARLELVAVEGGVARIRAEASARLRREIERVVADAAPELERVDVVPWVGRGGEDLVPLARLVRRADEQPHERCEICGGVLAGAHPHLLDVGRRRIACACAPCDRLLAPSQGAFRRIRRVVRRLDGFRLDDTAWATLGVPVALAFFTRSSSDGAIVAAYPGPAGPTWAEVPPDAWAGLAAENPVLEALEPDTTALLVHRRGPAPAVHLVSIDECYRLTGLVRSRWQGLSGGDGASGAIVEFYDTLQETEATP